MRKMKMDKMRKKNFLFSLVFLCNAVCGEPCANFIANFELISQKKKNSHKLLEFLYPSKFHRFFFGKFQQITLQKTLKVSRVFTSPHSYFHQYKLNKISTRIPIHLSSYKLMPTASSSFQFFSSSKKKNEMKEEKKNWKNKTF